MTLIELLIAGVVVCVLASVSYPAYRDTVRKARRAEAKAALFGVMQQQERYFSLFNRYLAYSSASAEPDAAAFRWYSGSSAKKSAYEIAAAPCEGEAVETCIRLTARPGTDKVDASFQDEECGELFLTSQGVRGARGNAHACWQ